MKAFICTAFEAIKMKVLCDFFGLLFLYTYIYT